MAAADIIRVFTACAPFRLLCRASASIEVAHRLLPNDVASPSSASLLFPANLLIFSAKLGEATKLARA